MKKIIISLLFFIITGCNKTEGIPDGLRDDFSVGTHDISDYDINTYYLDVLLDEEDEKLYVSGEIVYVNDKTNFNELYITLYPNTKDESVSTNNVNIDYIMVNGSEVNYEFRGFDYSQIYIELDETLMLGTNFNVEFDSDFLCLK